MKYELHCTATYPTRFLASDGSTWVEDRSNAGAFTRERISKMIDKSTRTLAGVWLHNINMYAAGTNNIVLYWF